MKRKRIHPKGNKSFPPRFITKNALFFILLSISFLLALKILTPKLYTDKTIHPSASSNNQIPSNTNSYAVTTPNPGREIPISQADWLGNSYQYYDANLDATFTIPNGWHVVNDPSRVNPTLTKEGTYEKIYCYERKFFKDSSQCPETKALALYISPDPSAKSNYLAIIGLSEGLGGGCTDEYGYAHATVRIQDTAYDIKTRDKKADGSFNSCFNSTFVKNNGNKSNWAGFKTYHLAENEAMFITEMQILENIQFP